MLKEKLSARQFPELLHENRSSQIIAKILEHSRHQDQRPAKSLIYDLTKLTVQKDFPLDVFIQICDSVNKENNDFIQKYLPESLWLIGLGLEKLSLLKKPNEEQEREFSLLVSHVVKRKILNKMKLMEKFEEHSLYVCGFISDKDGFNKKMIRANTNLMYFQF